MHYSNNREIYSQLESHYEIKKSLHRVAFDDKNPSAGGIPLFAEPDAVYVEQDDTHTLVIGSTGSKKTRLIGMPALQTYANAGESFICTDPKAELYKRIYPLVKKNGYNIFVLNLRDPAHSDSWNPLRIPYLQYKDGQKDKAIEQVTDMAVCISKGNIHDSYWDNCAADMLTGLILILFEHANENEIHFKSLRSLRTQAYRTEEKEAPYLKNNYLQYLEQNIADTHFFIVYCGRDGIHPQLYHLRIRSGDETLLLSGQPDGHVIGK